MNTLITGGYGLLGSSINFGIKPKKEDCDVLNYNQLSNFIEHHNIDSIVHCAAKVGGVKANSDYMFDFFYENMLMNLNILNSCKTYKINKSIFIISTCVFPENAPLPLKEEYLHTGEPHYTNFGYAYSKRMLDVGSRSLHQQYGLSSVCLIPCNLYGENDNYNLDVGHVIPSLIHKCYLAKINNTPFEIWGDGNAERQFMYVGDFAKIIEIMFNKSLVGNIIISPDNIFTIKEIVENIAKIFSFKGKIVFDSNKPQGILRKNCDNSKFKSVVPGFNFTSLETGLSSTIEYFVKNYDRVRK